ncbi:hypothetical protein FOL47_003263 [Perkinsus chesapeaki]|uniref:GAF domain-containing protein n=1 Tax=Perkinsus chesapeaki TaxID=330153 RepID=A0A7J6N5J8_PERCH|nr:hypothetical protein FOL47_003263 [Perkinsus chesapeaki]
MTAKLPEEVPLRSSARLHGVKLSQAVFDEDSLRSTPRKTREVGKTNKPSATPKRAAPEVTGLESPANKRSSISHKKKPSSRKRAHTATSASTPKPKAKAEAKRVPKRKGVSDPLVEQGSSVIASLPQGETECLANAAGTPEEGKKKSVIGGRVRKTISKNVELTKTHTPKRREVRVVVESRVSRAGRPTPLSSRKDSGEQQDNKQPKCDAALPRGNREETQKRGMAVFERALPMGLMAAGVVSTMLVANFENYRTDFPLLAVSHEGDTSKDCSVTALSGQPGSPDMIWVAREDKSLLGIDVRSNVVQSRITLPAAGELVGNCVASSTSVYVGAESNILNYDIRKGMLAAAYVPQNQTNEVNNFSLSPDGSQLLVPTDEGELVFLDSSTLAECREKLRVNEEEQVCSCVTARVSPSCPTTTTDILVGGFDCTVRRFAVERASYRSRGVVDVAGAVKDESSTLPMAFNPPFVNCIQFDPFHNDAAVAGTGSGALCLMRFRGDSLNFKDFRKSILRIPAHSQAVADLTFLRDHCVTSVGSDGRLTLSSLLGTNPRVLEQVDLGWKPSAIQALGDGARTVVGTRLPAIYDPKSPKKKKKKAAAAKRDKVHEPHEHDQTTASSWTHDVSVDSLAGVSASTWKTDLSSRSRGCYKQRLNDIREACDDITLLNKTGEPKMDNKVAELLEMCVEIVEKQKWRWDQVRGALTLLSRRKDIPEGMRAIESISQELGDCVCAESRIVELAKKLHTTAMDHGSAVQKCNTLERQVKKLESDLTVAKIELANKTKECEVLQRRANADAQRFEHLSRNVGILQHELAVVTAEKEGAGDPNNQPRDGPRTSRGTRIADDKGLHAKRARYLANQLATSIQQMTVLERQKKWWMAKSAVLEAEVVSLIAYHEKLLAANSDEEARSKLTQVVWKIMNESPLAAGYGFVNTVSHLKSILGDAVGHKIDKLPVITPYKQRGTTLIAPFKSNGVPIPKAFMNLSPQQIDFLTMVTSTRGRCTLPYLCDADFVATERGRLDCINALGTEFWAQQKYSAAISRAFGRLKSLFEVHAIDHLINTLINISCEALDCDRGSIWVVDATQGIMWTYVQNAEETDYDRLEVELPKRGTDPYAEGIGLVASAYLLRDSVSIYDAYEDKRFNSSFDRITNYRTRSVLCVPIVNDGKVTCIVQAVNKRRDPIFDHDDEIILRNIAVLGLEMLLVFEKTAVSGWSMKRELSSLREVHLSSVGRSRVFVTVRHGDDAALHKSKCAYGDAEFVAGGVQHHHEDASFGRRSSQIDSKQLDRQLRPCAKGMTGVVGHTVRSRCPQTFTLPSMTDDGTPKKGQPDKLAAIYDPSVDLSPPDSSESYIHRRDSSKEETYVLHSYPLFDKRTTTGVLQFICVEGKRKTFDNDELFDPRNVGHTKVLKQLCNYVVVFLREWYPMADRRAIHDLWVKSAKTLRTMQTFMSGISRLNTVKNLSSSASTPDGDDGDEQSAGEVNDDGSEVDVTVTGGGQLWGLTEEERQADWSTAEPGWEVRNISTIYQTSLELGLLATKDAP